MRKTMLSGKADHVADEPVKHMEPADLFIWRTYVLSVVSMIEG